MSFQDIIPLSNLSRELRGMGISKSYQSLHRYAANGFIPAGRLGAMWAVSRSDLPAIAASLSAPVRRVRA